LNQTVQYCGVEELRTLRLVSRQWNESATKFLRQILNPITFSDEFYDLEKMININSILKGSELSPCVKFGITSSFLTNENEKVLRDFFSTCGSFMENLTICVDQNKRNKFEIFEDFYKKLHLPKLKHLVLEDHTPLRAYNTSHSSTNTDLTPIFKAILSAAVNLEKLSLYFPKSLYGFECEDLDPGPTLPQLPEGLLCHRPCRYLSHLDISAKLTDDQLMDMSQAGLRLKTLQFRMRNVTLQENSFTTLLQSQSKTLVELKLREERTGSNFIVKFPKMERLSVISISSVCEFEENSLTFGPFGFQEHLPAIKTLELWDCFGREERWSAFFLAVSPSYSLEKLELPAQFRNTSLAQNISVVFPYLKKLKVGFSLRPENESVLRTVYSSLKNLEELQIITDMDHQNENIDHILTGFSKEVCKKLRTSVGCLRPHMDFDQHQYRRESSLADLKSTKHFYYNRKTVFDSHANTSTFYCRS